MRKGSSLTCVEHTGNIWENPQVFHVNKRASHVPLHSFPSEEAAIEYFSQVGRSSEGENHLGQRTYLDGYWDFKLYDCPEDVPSGFWAPEALCQNWGKVRCRRRIGAHVA